MKWRIITLISFFGVLYLALVFQLYNVQFKKNAFYEAKAASQQIASGILEPTRGQVYFVDKNGNRIPAIMNKKFDVVYAVPKEIADPAAAAAVIAKALGMDASEVERKLTKKNDEYEVLKVKAAKEEVDAVRGLNIKGIYTKQQLGRFYPLGTLAAHVLGFVSPLSEKEKEDGTAFSERGRYGIEAKFDDELAGSMGKIKGDRVLYPTDGKDIVLTIDRNIQAQAEELIKGLYEKWGAQSATVIVEEPKTGKILAMGSYPTFDPNDYGAADVKDFLNPAIQSLYEPGSVMKPITMTAGIDAGKITPETAYQDTGLVVVNKMPIRNWDKKAYGHTTMTGVIEHSLNVGTVFAERTMGNDVFKEYFLNKYKFGEKTGIALPGERSGNIANVEQGQDVALATAAFGQGIAITPIKSINAIATVANRGTMMRPLIREDEQPEEIRRVVSEDAARKVAQMMVSAVHVNKIAEIDNYNVAGKTGTAYIPNFGGKGYSDDVINTYEGFAPAFDPKFVILIKLERPKGSPLAGTTVVPAFRDLAQFILNYYNIAPDAAAGGNR